MAIWYAARVCSGAYPDAPRWAISCLGMSAAPTASPPAAAATATKNTRIRGSLNMRGLYAPTVEGWLCWRCVCAADDHASQSDIFATANIVAVHGTLRSQMARIHELAGLYAALGDATRLRILGVLADGEVCVGHIHVALRLPQPTISRHLPHLRRAGLVRTRREGLWVHYALAEITDPSARAALSAAIHAIGHAPATRSDQGRLELRMPRTGKGPLPVIACS